MLGAFDRITTNNLRGAIIARKHVLPLMPAQRAGVIITISSVATREQYPNVAYKATKAGMIVLRRSLVGEAAIHPITDTARTAGAAETGQWLQIVARRKPLYVCNAPKATKFCRAVECREGPATDLSGCSKLDCADWRASLARHTSAKHPAKQAGEKCS